MQELYGDLGEVFKNPERQNESDQGGYTSLLLTSRSFNDFPRGVFNEFLAARSIYAHSYSGQSPSLQPPRSASSTSLIHSMIPHNLYPTLLYCVQTGEVPVAIHFNNHLHKGLIDEWWGKLWWNNLGRGVEEVRGCYGCVVGGDRKRWSDICSNHNLLDV